MPSGWCGSTGSREPKMQTNCSKCQELGWACTPLAVETYGNWAEVAQVTFSMQTASHLAISQSRPKALVVADIYTAGLTLIWSS